MSRPDQTKLSHSNKTHLTAAIDIWQNLTPFLICWSCVQQEWTILEDELRNEDEPKMKTTSKMKKEPKNKDDLIKENGIKN